MKYLITGGAGFVGSFLAVALKQRRSSDEVVALDNLHRRGSETNLSRLRQHGVHFVHGDIRSPADLRDLEGNFDVLLECSAEPSVLAGTSGSPAYVLETNLSGTLNCLEFARLRAKAVVFLSTSRVYSIAPLRGLPLKDQTSRLELPRDWSGAGASWEGISELFPTHLPRSFYGASKLASELILQEYGESTDLSITINRCGVICGPGQFGKVDQGVFSLWVRNHQFGDPVQYRGFGGQGKQVRDLLHPKDLFDLVDKQLAEPGRGGARVFNVGGGRKNSASLREWTEICRRATGKEVPEKCQPDSPSVDIPYYISDNSEVRRTFQWQPRIGLEEIAAETLQWAKANESFLRGLPGGGI